MTKTNKLKTVTLAAGIALFLSGFLCTGFKTASADTGCNHAYEAKEVAATCTTGAYTLYECNDCGHTYTETTAAANGHSFKEIVVPQSCTHKGYTTYFCTICGYEYSDDFLDEYGHSYIEEIIDPTCEDKGYTKHTCGICGDFYFDDYVDALGHNYEIDVTEPDCFNGGYTTYICLNCNDSYIGNYTEPNRHFYSVSVHKATCATYGYIEHICEGCGDRYVTDYEQPKGHSYLDILVPATADSFGYTRHLCVDCDYSYLSDYVTSGDDGYIVPPEEPEVPEIHKHTYELHTLDESENMSLVVIRACNCGDTKSGYYTVKFTDEDGVVTESKQTGKRIDYSEFCGQVVISITDEEGTELKTVVVTANEKAVEPIIPDQPVEPDKSTADKTKKSGNGVAIALFVFMVVIALGGVGGFILYKKFKNKKQK